MACLLKPGLIRLRGDRKLRARKCASARGDDLCGQFPQVEQAVQAVRVTWTAHRQSFHSKSTAGLRLTQLWINICSRVS